MKKIVALVAVLFSVVVPVQAQAESKSLVIIDAYFDSRATGATVICAPTLNCSKAISSSTSFTANVNHGDAMVEVAKRQGAKNIIALMSASGGSDVNAGYFIEALKWVQVHSNEVSAVSISRKLNSTTQCLPSPTNTANYGGSPIEADKVIRKIILELKNVGIPVFASTGNNGKTGSVDYPACILDTASVTANNYTQATSDANTDYIGSLPSSIYSYNGTIKWSTNTLIPQTTSSATAATAAKWVVNGALVDKVVPVLS